MNQLLYRVCILSLIPIVVASSVVSSRFTGQPKIVEVTITIPGERNLTLNQGLLELANLSDALAKLADEGPQNMGASFEEIVFLVEVVENSADRMWSKLHQEVVDQYQAISSMTFRFHQALVHPQILNPDWFEDPTDASRYSEEARELGITSTQQGKVRIELGANMSMVHATSTDSWTTSSGKTISVNTTYVLVRIEGIWKYRNVSWVSVGS